MGFMDEIRKLTRPYSEAEEDFEDDYEEEEEEELEAASPSPRSVPARRGGFNNINAEPARNDRRAVGKVMNINNAATQLQVVLVKPDRFDNVSDIADHLRDKRAIVLNLEATPKETARRLVDFLSGCAYALDGRIKKVALSTYILTPYNVDIVGDLVEELENSGAYL